MLKEKLVEKILERGRFFDTYKHNWSWQGYISSSSGSGIGVECLVDDRYYKSGIISHRHPYYNCWNTEKDYNKRNRMYAEMIADNIIVHSKIILDLGFVIENED